MPLLAAHPGLLVDVDAQAAVAALATPGPRTLILAGDRDLSTPLVWATATAAAMPGSRLVVVPGAGHSVQSRGGPRRRRGGHRVPALSLRPPASLCADPRHTPACPFEQARRRIPRRSIGG